LTCQTSMSLNKVKKTSHTPSLYMFKTFPNIVLPKLNL